MSIEPVIFIETNEQIKEVMALEKSCILYFNSTKCTVCDVILSKLMDVVDNYPIKVAKINIDKHIEIAGQFLIFTVPTILMIHKGGEILRESRFIDFYKVKKTLNFVKEEL